MGPYCIARCHRSASVVVVCNAAGRRARGRSAAAGRVAGPEQGSRVSDCSRNLWSAGALITLRTGYQSLATAIFWVQKVPETEMQDLALKTSKVPGLYPRRPDPETCWFKHGSSKTMLLNAPQHAILG